MCKWNPNAPRICVLCGRRKTGWEHVCRGRSGDTASPVAKKKPSKVAKKGGDRT